MLDPKEVLEKYRKFVELYPIYKELVMLDYLPVEYYNVYEKWKPDRVKVLFLAESPSWFDKSIYFYNESCEVGLSQSIPEYLGIKESSKTEILEEFKRRGFFMIDTIKCVFNKKARKSIPNNLIKFSALEILQQEIESLNPKCILVLGSTAMIGLKFIDHFAPTLSEINSITKACGKAVEIEKMKIIFSTFPNNRNKQYGKNIQKAFTTALEDP